MTSLSESHGSPNLVNMKYDLGYTVKRIGYSDTPELRR